MNEAELLFTEIFNTNRAGLYLDKDLRLDKDKAYFISTVLRRRIQGEPLQYILGKCEFMGLEFKVTPDVMIPRPETEILVEKGIDLVRSLGLGVRSKELGVRSWEILDIGTGSGCIGISLAKFLQNCKVTAVDISENALIVAKENAKLNNVEINFLHSDLFNARELESNRYDLIVSNPPYIPSSEIDSLEIQLQYEPRIALDGGMDGLDFYRRIICQAQAHLKADGFLILEIGFGQAIKIKNILEKTRNFAIIDIVKDYNSIDRVVVAKFSGRVDNVKRKSKK